MTVTNINFSSLLLDISFEDMNKKFPTDYERFTYKDTFKEFALNKQLAACKRNQTALQSEIHLHKSIVYVIYS